jgi:hypothetical protein
MKSERPSSHNRRDLLRHSAFAAKVRVAPDLDPAAQPQEALENVLL